MEIRIVAIFFFQAEDGIRDADVTGVQTCALPILSSFFRRQTLPKIPWILADLNLYCIYCENPGLRLLFPLDPCDTDLFPTFSVSTSLFTYEYNCEIFICLDITLSLHLHS